MASSEADLVRTASDFIHQSSTQPSVDYLEKTRQFFLLKSADVEVMEYEPVFSDDRIDMIERTYPLEEWLSAVALSSEVHTDLTEVMDVAQEISRQLDVKNAASQGAFYG